MTGEEVRRHIDGEWQAFQASLGELEDHEMLEPGVVGDWSVRELLGHIAFWDDVAARNAGLVAAGRSGEIVRPRGEEDTAAWNERERRERRDHTLAQARDESAASHERMLSALASLPEGRLGEPAPERPLWRLLAEDTLEHYKEHRGQVEAWLRRVETSEI